MLPHLFNLVARSWANVLNSLGTTTLSMVLFTLAAPVITFVVSVIAAWRSQPKETIMDYAHKSILPTIIGLSVPLVMIACVLCWKVVRTVYDDHNDLVAKVQALQDPKLGDPRLKGEIPQVAGAPAGKNNSDCLLTVMIEITNSGAPSIVRRISAHVELSTGQVIDGIGIPPSIVPTKLYSGRPDSSPFTVLLPSDYLPRKAIENPVPTGGAVMGYAQYIMKGVTRDQIFRPGVKVRLNFYDIDNRAYTAERIMTGHHETMDYDHLQDDASRE